MEEQRKAALLDHLSSVTRALVLGTLLTAAVQGVLLGTGFAIVGLPSPVVFGSAGCLASVVPFVGTALVWVPAVLVLLVQGRMWAAIFFLIWSVGLVASVDNVISCSSCPAGPACRPSPSSSASSWVGSLPLAPSGCSLAP